MFRASNIHYEVADRTQAAGVGGHRRHPPDGPPDGAQRGDRREAGGAAASSGRLPASIALLSTRAPTPGSGRPGSPRPREGKKPRLIMTDEQPGHETKAAPAGPGVPRWLGSRCQRRACELRNTLVLGLVGRRTDSTRGKSLVWQDGAHSNPRPALSHRGGAAPSTLPPQRRFRRLSRPGPGRRYAGGQPVR